MNISSVKIQSRAPGTTAWTALGADTFSPFIDTRPLANLHTPEIREYRLCHFDDDTPMNNWSDVLVVECDGVNPDCFIHLRPGVGLATL